MCLQLPNWGVGFFFIVFVFSSFWVNLSSISHLYASRESQILSENPRASALRDSEDIVEASAEPPTNSWTPSSSEAESASSCH